MLSHRINWPLALSVRIMVGSIHSTCFSVCARFIFAASMDHKYAATGTGVPREDNEQLITIRAPNGSVSVGAFRASKRFMNPVNRSS